MSALMWYGITFGLIAAFVGIILYLRKKDLLERYHLQIYGPFLMWKTVKGRDFLERLAKRKRFWNAYADISIWITMAAMFTMIGLLLWSAVYVLTIEPKGAPNPTYVVGLPGINPVIPLWYGIIALAVAIVIHEGAHGILALVGKLKIKSLGLLWFVIPVGAFVEPDEEALKAARPKVRDRMAAVGPATNILFAVVCALIFSNVFMAALNPQAEGILITGIVKDTPAEEGNLEEGMVLLNMTLMINGSATESTRVYTYDDFKGFMDKRSAGDTLMLHIFFEDGYNYRNVTLDDKANHTDDEDDRGKGYIGVGLMGRGTVEMRDVLVDPVAEADGDLGEIRSNVLTYSIVLPFAGVVPFPEWFTDIYEPTGPIAELSEPGFWILANIFYWLFWLNLMVGISNALPAVPFDGSYLFHDYATGFFKKLGYKGDRLEKVVGRMLIFTTLGVFFLVFWQIIGPYVGSALR